MICCDGFPVERTTNKIVTIKENGKSVRIINKESKEIKKVQIDCKPCPIKNEKCDFLVFETEESLFFIELKGKDIEKAVKQLESTLEFFNLKSCKKTKKTLIVVCSRYPKASTKKQKLQLHFMKNYGAKFDVKERNYEFAIS
jgi:ribosomal protein L25 (general stress protein Ctc)